MSHTNSNTQNRYSELRTVKGNTDVYSDSHNEPDTTDCMNCPDETRTENQTRSTTLQAYGKNGQLCLIHLANIRYEAFFIFSC